MAAIYMWIGEGSALYLTTTLYPLEDEAAIDLDLAIEEGRLTLVPADDAKFTSVLPLDSTYIQVRWFYEYGPVDDDAKFTSVLPLDGTYIQVRWFYEYGPVDDDAKFTSVLPLDATLVNKGVLGDSPDESLDIDLAIDSSCSMTAV